MSSIGDISRKYITSAVFIKLQQNVAYRLDTNIVLASIHVNNNNDNNDNNNRFIHLQLYKEYTSI